MSLAPGTRLGSYEIVAPLGAGGMGAVYRARDPRLNREVAIKILSAQLAGDPAALARFEREAMSVAKISHPNILSIFEFAHEGDTAFVVTELVDGETLRTRLEGGPLAPRRAIAYALQMAKGIAAAHARGIVHRDLKPENVMITRDDQVKVLDFGLAKTVEATQSDMTRGRSVATSAGTVLGTFGYMAPEQVRALATDQRADIFAFGAVLYEMLCGERAYRGETAADTMTAILTKDPPELDAGRLSLPAGLDRIVRRCLEKSPDLRFQSANDLAFALENLSSVSTPSSAVPPVTVPIRRAPRAWVPWTVAALAILAAAASWMRPRGSAPEPRFDHFTRITDGSGEETAPALSPDGGTVAYALNVNGNWDIYAQRVGGRNATPIVNDRQRNEGGPAYSPDGAAIAFHESDDLGGIFVAGATGESVRRVTDIGFDPAWSSDGKQIAFGTEEISEPSSRLGDSTLYVVDAGGGTPRKLVDGDGVQPSWSPSGERLVYWSNTGGQRDIYTVAAAGGPRVAVTSDPALDWSPVWSPDGRFIYFSSDRGGAMNLWRIALDQSSGRPQGGPEQVTGGVQASAALPRFSKSGTRMVFRSRVGSVNPVGVPIDPATLQAGEPFMLDARNTIRIPSDVSADGKQVAYYNLGEMQEDVFVGPIKGAMRRVTDDGPRDRAPVFTPDGRSLVFYSNRDGNWALWMIGVDGGNLRKLASPKSGVVYVQLSPKGDQAVFVSTSGREAFILPLGSDRGASPQRLEGTVIDRTYFTPMGWSTDGQSLAGVLAADSGRTAGVGVYDLASHTTRRLSQDETYAVKWLADSRRVVYFTDRGWTLVVIDTVTGTRSVVSVRLPAPSMTEMIAVAPDGRTIYYGAANAQADIWAVDRK